MKKINILSIIALILLILLTGCSRQIDKSMRNHDDYQYNVTDFEYLSTDNNYLSSDKMIVTGETEIETYDLDKALSEINSLISDYQAIVKSSKEGKYTYNDWRYASLTIYVPAEKFNEFQNELKNIGNIISSYYNNDNITTEYNDTNSRLLSLQAQEEKVRELYDKCSDISEMIQIEQRLSEIESEITIIQNKLNNYDLLITYSTLTINLKEVNTYTKVESGFFSRLFNAIKNSLNNFLSLLEDILLFIGNNLFTIAILIILIILSKK